MELIKKYKVIFIILIFALIFAGINFTGISSPFKTYGKTVDKELQLDKSKCAFIDLYAKDTAQYGMMKMEKGSTITNAYECTESMLIRPDVGGLTFKRAEFKNDYTQDKFDLHESTNFPYHSKKTINFKGLKDDEAVYINVQSKSITGNITEILNGVYTNESEPLTLPSKGKTFASINFIAKGSNEEDLSYFGRVIEPKGFVSVS
ncbi:MAG: hypothetical protein ACK5HS_01060 [Mycoplasmatales bacterium]